MTTAVAREFFQASADVAGALIGLLFVAISVTSGRTFSAEESEVRGVRAAATLSALTNGLAVALFGLVPGFNVGTVAMVVGILGLLRIGGALLRVVPRWRAGPIRLWDLSFLVGLAVVFAIQLFYGIGLDRHPHDVGDLQAICVLVVVCFLIGIARAWELVGGPNVDLLGRGILKRLWNPSAAEGSAEDS